VAGGAAAGAGVNGVGGRRSEVGGEHEGVGWWVVGFRGGCGIGTRGQAVRTLGVDLSAQAARTAVCEVVWRGGSGAGRSA
jgi:hypothetical protein